MAHKCITQLLQVFACAKTYILKIPSCSYFSTGFNFRIHTHSSSSFVGLAATRTLKLILLETVRRNGFSKHIIKLIKNNDYRMRTRDVSSMEDSKLMLETIGFRNKSIFLKNPEIVDSKGIPDRPSAAGDRRPSTANTFRILSRAGKFDRCSCEVPTSMSGKRRLHETLTQFDADKKNTINKLFTVVQKKTEAIENKVTMVGVGQVGMAAVFAMVTQNVTNNIAMVDVEPKRLQAEIMDLQHGSCFLKPVKIQGSTDYAISAGSKVCVVTAGVRQRTGESRLALVQRNTDVLKNIIPKLMKHSPNTILLIASNPVDVLTYAAWKLSGVSKNRVIGSGTNLDSARFRFLLSEKLGVATTSCHGYIIGEHGDSAVPVWSGVNVAGVRLTELNQKIGTNGDPEKWIDVYHTMVKSSYEVHRLKGYTSWAIGLSLCQIVKAILSNANTVHPVSTCLKGEHGIKDEVFLSLPCVLNHSGIADVVRQTLTESERKMLQKAAQALAKIQAGIKF